MIIRKIVFLLCFLSFTSLSHSKILKVHTLKDFQKSLRKSNVTICINSPINLDEEKIVIPKGVMLKVNSSIRNGTIVGNNTAIQLDENCCFSNVAFEGTYNVPAISYQHFSNYINDTELLRAMFNLTFQNKESSILYLEPNRIYNVEYYKLNYAHAIYEYISVSNKKIEGNGSLINDKRSRSMMSYTSYDGVLLFNGCHGITINNLNYQNLSEDYVQINDENGSVKYASGIENQIGYVGSSFILLYNDCSDIHITSEITGARYGVKSGDYSKFWLCGDYGVKSSSFNITAHKTGYPIAIEIGDSLEINVKSDTHHRACYLCGISNSTIKVRAKNIMIAPVHCLLSDTHYSKGDKDNPRFKPCYNLKVAFTEMGSDIVESSDVFCIAFQTYNNSPFFPRKTPLVWHDIKVNIKKDKPSPKVGLFSITRNFASNSNDPLSIQDVFKDITIIADDPFESTQWAARVRTSDMAIYENIHFKINAPKANAICDNANPFSFDFSDSYLSGLYYSGNVTVDKNKIRRIVEIKSSIKAKGHQLSNINILIMNRLSLYWQIIYNKIRFAIIKFLNPKSQIDVEGSTLVSTGADIEVGRYALLQIGRGLHVRKNAILAVRDNAKLQIGKNVFINRNTIVMSRQSIVIESGVTIGPNVCIYDHDHDIQNRGGYYCRNVIIKKNVWIGSNVTILKGVAIGEGAIVASGCIVTKDVPSHTILIQKRNSIYKSLDYA